MFSFEVMFEMSSASFYDVVAFFFLIEVPQHFARK